MDLWWILQASIHYLYLILKPMPDQNVNNLAYIIADIHSALIYSDREKTKDNQKCIGLLSTL